MGVQQDIANRVEALAEAEGLVDNRAFGYWFLEDTQQLSREDALLTITDGPWDHGRDAVYYDELLGSLHIYQFKYTFDSLTYALSGLSDLQRALEYEKEKLTATKELWLYLVTMVKLGPDGHAEVDRVKKEAESWLAGNGYDISVVIEVFDLDRFIQLYERIEGVQITLDYKVQPMGVDSGIIGLVDAATFRSVIDKEELLAFNIRQFLGLRKGSVNTEIFESLKDESNRGEFWKLNNGLVCLCTDYQEITDRRIRFSDLTVVNGAQTISTISRFLKENPLVSGPIWVLSKIIKVSPSDIDAAVKLTKTSNTQNAANNKDLRAIDVAHSTLEDWFRSYCDITYIYKRGQSAPHGNSKLEMKDLAQAYTAFWLERPDVSFARSGTIFSSNETYGSVFPGDDIEELKAVGDDASIGRFLSDRRIPVDMLREIRCHINEKVRLGDDTKWRSLSFQILWLYRLMFERAGILEPGIEDWATDVVRETISDVYKHCKVAAGLLGLEVPKDLKTELFTGELRSNEGVEELFSDVELHPVQLHDDSD